MQISAIVEHLRGYWWILLRFYNLSNSVACVTMSFWPTADVNDAVPFVIWLHKVGLLIFCFEFKSLSSRIN